MESPYMATIGSETEQVSADPTNTIEYGGATFVKLTASTYDIELQNGNKLVIDSEKVINEVEDDVPVSIQGGYSVVDLEPTPTDNEVVNSWTTYSYIVDNTTKRVYRLVSGELRPNNTISNDAVYLGNTVLYEDDTLIVRNIRTDSYDSIYSYSYAYDIYSRCGWIEYKNEDQPRSMEFFRGEVSRGGTITFQDVN